MKKNILAIFTGLVLFSSLINLSYQFQTAIEMRQFQNEILQGFQDFAENIASDKSNFTL